MPTSYELIIKNPSFNNLGYVMVVANLNEKHDRSAPSDHHWKILKCRMIIFSNSSILASPDQKDVKRIHVIFNKIGDDYDKLNSLLMKFSLIQDGEIQVTTPEIFQMCLQYTIIAKIAPTWNTVGLDYLINNRDFLTAIGAQTGLQYRLTSNDCETILTLKAVKINFIRSNENYLPGEWIRVLPSLIKAVVEDYSKMLPQSARFKCYKDLRRHWKNIHGYRLPEEECPYYLIRFWRGDPLTYPQCCVTRNFPIITPIPQHEEVIAISRFVNYLKTKSPKILGEPLQIHQRIKDSLTTPIDVDVIERVNETQAISLCTPTQSSRV